jgi:uncharacterized protein (TIGR02217 family)
MAFIETRLLDQIRYGISCGPQFSTTIVQVNSGATSRNQNWLYPLHKADFAEVLKDDATKDLLLSAIWACAGRANGFRFRDYNDYTAKQATGYLGTGYGDGSATYQMYKRYSFGPVNVGRKITKPVASKVTVYRQGVPVSTGTGSGQCTIDTTTGIVTFYGTAPTAAQTLAWSGEFDIPMAFDLDYMPFVFQAHHVWECTQLTATELRL